jgi:precorrin-6A/cobalt-precorrin-6A reductase
MIWVMAGTGDSKKIIDKLKKYNLNPLITLATPLGEKSFKDYLNVTTQKMSFIDMVNFIKNKSIKLIIDVTHPFAYEVSKNAMKAAEKVKIKYIRYEREQLKADYRIIYNDYNRVAEKLKKSKGNILLTIGVKNLNYFSELKKERLYVKILPVKYSFNECIKHNILENNIIGLKGIISIRLLRAIIKEYKIEHLVMKDSGKEGGADIKLKACKKEGIRPYIIKRDVIEYPEIYQNINKLINRVKKEVKNEAI